MTVAASRVHNLHSCVQSPLHASMQGTSLGERSTSHPGVRSLVVKHGVTLWALSAAVMRRASGFLDKVFGILAK